MELTKEQNKALCEEYPFLIPTNRWSGMRITEADNGGFWPGTPDHIPEYDYEYTELDEMPDGWRIAFGEQLCDELKEQLEKDGGLDQYRITQIKEKYGMLCWYDYGGNEQTFELLRRYEQLSKRICIICGAPATRITTGWISPYCDACCKYTSVPIDEFYHSSGAEGDCEGAE